MWTDRRMDRKMDKKQTNGQENGQTNRRNYTNFERNLAMMVICIPVKYEFNWTKCFRVWSPETKMWTNRWMDRQTDKNGQTNKRNFTNFDRNLAMMVMYVPVKLNLIGLTVFELESGKKNVDGQMDGQKNGAKTNKRTKKRTNEQTELHQFRKEPSYDGDLCPCQV